MHHLEQLRWLKSRYHSMESGEILSRLADAGRHLALRASHRRVGAGASAQFKALSSLAKAPTFSNGYAWSVTREEQDLINQTASNWLKHQASFFSLRNTPLGNPIEWQRDYLSGVVGPKSKYTALINHRDVTLVGDVKYVWELNRLQHLVLLALASVWTGKKDYKEEIVRQTLSWIAENPFMMGVNWKSPLEAAIRLISWAFVSCLTDNKIPDVLNNPMRATIYQHQYFIRKFYSKHSSANNHLIGEMAGLYVASIIWPLYRESSSWQSLARNKLLEEIVRQVEADGVGKECATEYQLFILEFFLIAGALGQGVGDPFPEQFWQRLGSMITFLSAISDRNGNLPMFGDGDSSQVVGLPDTASSRVCALVRLGDLRRKPISNSIATDVRSRFLLWGQRPENIPITSKLERHQGLQTFPRGGYYVLSADRGHDDEMLVVLDTGPLGLPPLYAHGHADALSFWLSYGGHEFFVDPGTFSYYTHDSWRAYFRSTAAHNTVRIDDQDQSIPGGRFLWSHVANCQVDHTEENDDFVEVEALHDGYRRLADPVIHRRCLRLYKQSKKLLIGDTLNCADSHDIEVFFHFNESCQVEQTAPTSFAATHENSRLRINLDPRLKPELLRGSENPILGWVSRTYGLKKPSFTLVGRARLTGSRQLITEIAPL
jgi:Heparinase II/III-like protein/Heparinase II/III N-terminus